jgi:hypothetical protein
MEAVQLASCSGRLSGAQQVFRASKPSTQQLLATGSRRNARAERRQQTAVASMGIGFHDVHSPPSGELLLPDSPDYGLTVKQMQVLGLTNADSFASKLPEVKAVSAATE